MMLDSVMSPALHILFPRMREIPPACPTLMLQLMPSSLYDHLERVEADPSVQAKAAKEQAAKAETNGKAKASESSGEDSSAAKVCHDAVIFMPSTLGQKGDDVTVWRVIDKVWHWLKSTSAAQKAVHKQYSNHSTQEEAC